MTIEAIVTKVVGAHIEATAIVNGQRVQHHEVYDLADDSYTNHQRAAQALKDGAGFLPGQSIGFAAAKLPDGGYVFVSPFTE